MTDISKSNEGSGGSVKKLDTKEFNNAIEAYKDLIVEFEGIVGGIEKSTTTILNEWKGKGSEAFSYDCQQIQLNLKDINDLMYEIRDALIQASAEYIKFDLAIEKKIEI